MKRKDPFGAPDGYFDSLADRIEDRIRAEEESASKNGKVIRMSPVIGYAAAAVITLLTVVWLVMKESPAPTSDQLIAELSDEEIIDYLVASDMPLEEIIEITSFGALESDSLDMQVMPELDLDSSEIDDLFDEYDLDELENS